MKRLRPPLTDAGEKWIVMSIQKECADRLRETYRNLTGSKLKSGHAHELVDFSSHVFDCSFDFDVFRRRGGRAGQHLVLHR